MYNTLKKNGYLCTDKEAERRLKTNEYILLYNFGKDEKLVAYQPYIPLMMMDFNEINKN